MELQTTPAPLEAASGSPFNLTAELVSRVQGYRADTLPADVVQVAKHCLLDWIGVTLSGSREPVTQILLEHALAEGGAGQCALVGLRDRVSPAQACLINGAASHSQDYDDVLEMMLGHPSVTVAPVVLALGEAHQRNGADVLAAFVAGVQTEAAVGVLVEPAHHEQGWHTTATLGTFGAASAASHLLDLSEPQWAAALGLAATSAGGLKSMFGTMGKPFHAGKAAASGYLAASLAARGMTSAIDVLEHPRGFLEVTTPGVGRVGTVLPADAFAIRQVLFKTHASCYLTHSAIEGVMSISRDNHLRAGDIERIEARVLPVHRTTCPITEARTGLEAKFSVEYAVAVALVEGRAGEQQFRNEVVTSPDVRAVADRVVLREGDWTHSQMSTPVQVITRDGRQFDATVDTGLPAQGTARASQWQELVAKFEDLAGPVIGSKAAEQVVALVQNFERLEDLGDLVGLMACPEST